MRPLNLFLVCCLLASPTLAQDDTDAPPEEGEVLDIFDGDAEDSETGWPRFTVSLGYMWLDADGTFDIEGRNGNRVRVIDLDRLGVDDTTGTVWGTINWRSRTSKWGGWFGYWDFSGAGFRVWEDELIIDDEVIVPVGAGVVTEITTDWYILEATYSFVQDDHWDIGVGFGFHIVDIETELAVAAKVGEETATESVARLDSLAPLPNFLGYVHYQFNEQWQVTARAGWFGLSYEEYDGQMINFHLLGRYNLNERWAVEAGYQFVELDVDINEDNYTGIFDMAFDGPMAVLRFYF